MRKMAGAVLTALLMVSGATTASAGSEPTGTPADGPRCAGVLATIVGTGSGELLVGGPTRDVIVAGGGADEVRGNGGRDIVCGGRGDDTLLGGKRADLLLGSKGDDLADGGRSKDSCSAETEISCVENKAPTDILLSNTSVTENQPAGTVVGTFSAADPNPADVHSFSLVDASAPTDGVDGVGNDNAFFRIVNGQLLTRQSFDAEEQDVLIIDVRARDFIHPRLHVFERFEITILNANEAPVVSTSAGSTPFTEDGGAVTVDNALTVSDVDDTMIEGATLSITQNFQSADRLVFVNTSNITGTYNTGTGVLTLTGADTVANYQAALRSTQYNYIGDDPLTSKIISIIVSDGDVNSMPASKGIAITPVNDAPNITTTATALTYTENAGAVPIDPDLTLSDPDSGQLTGATVQVTNNFFGSQDDLVFVDQSGITGSYDDSTGTLTLSGTASLADYRTALRSVAFRNNHDNPNTQTRTVSFQVMDGGSVNSLSNVATRDIEIDPVNDAPDLETSAGATTFDASDSNPVVVDNMLVVQNDPDDTNLESATVRISENFESGDTLACTPMGAVTCSYNAGTGVLTLTGSDTEATYQAVLRSVTYDSTGTPTVDKTIEFRANDGSNNSNPETKVIDVIP